MAEEKTSAATAGGAVDRPQSSPDSTATPQKDRPTFICEMCGPERPVDQVFQCTLCTMSFCVQHLALKHHYCVGALGKAQVP